MGPGAGASIAKPPAAGGLAGLTEIPSLDFQVGGSSNKKDEDDNGAYVPSFAVGGASRRPRRMLGR